MSQKEFKGQVEKLFKTYANRKDNKIHKEHWGQFALKIANGLQGDSIDFSSDEMATALSREIVSMDRDRDGSLEWKEIWPAMEGYYDNNLRWLIIF